MQIYIYKDTNIHTYKHMLLVYEISTKFERLLFAKDVAVACLIAYFRATRCPWTRFCLMELLEWRAMQIKLN